MTGRLLYLMIIGVLLFTVDGLGQKLTKDGIRIEVFSRFSKKPIPNTDLEDYTSINGLNDEIEKIVFSGKIFKPDNYKYFNLKIYKGGIWDDSDKELLLRKDNIFLYFDKQNKSYSLPIYPWIDEVGPYLIELERDGEIILRIKYQIIMTNSHE
ncbi:MAG: hypothetical protein ACKOFB_01700 [bacterium]